MHYAVGASIESQKIRDAPPRIDILESITSWINQDDKQQIYLLLGPKGSGKSTIAHTIARQFDAIVRLGSSYCFSCAAQDKRNATNLFSTIARDLADHDPQYMKALWATVKDKRALRETINPLAQFNYFILIPANQMTWIGPVLVVIDGLEQSGSESDRKDLLTALAEKGAELPRNFKLLVTCRPEEDICTAFGGKSHVIQKYLKHHADSHFVPPPTSGQNQPSRPRFRPPTPPTPPLSIPEFTRYNSSLGADSSTSDPTPISDIWSRDQRPKPRAKLTSDDDDDLLCGQAQTHATITPSSWKGQSIRLEVISGKNLKVPSERIPAGIYIFFNVEQRGRWKSTIGIPSSDESMTWGETVTLSLRKSSKLSLEIRASFELDRMLGNGEVVGKLETLWDALLDHGNEPFDMSFPSVRGVHPSLTLKATVLHDCDHQDSALLDSIVECQVAQDTDAGHERLATYVTSKTVSHLNDAVKHFQLVLDQCPVGHPDRAAALTNLTWARLEGYIQSVFQDIDSITSLFREALALRLPGHPDHPLSIYHLLKALIWSYEKENSTAIYIQECAQLSSKLFSLCPEGTYLRSIAAGANGVDYVICECNNLPKDASDEGIHLRRVILELCPLGNAHRPKALNKLAQAVEARFQQRGTIDDLAESIQHKREAVSLCPEGHFERETYLNNLAYSLRFRFDHQGNSDDIDEAISLFEEALRLRPVGHKYRNSSLDNLGSALHTRFNQRGDVDDIIRSISLQREALTLRPPGNPCRYSTLNNLALALKIRYVKLDASENLDEAINLHRDSLQLTPQGHPRRHQALCNLSSALHSRFTQTRKNEDIEEAIRLCQESLEALPSLHPDRYFSYMWLQEAYLSRFRVQRSSADLSLAVENFRLASRHPTQGFPERIKETINWTFAAESHSHTSALEAYKTFFELLDRHLATRSSIVARREAASAFRPARTLPVDAASCAMRLENLRDAIELVEQGRGQQWSLASRLRSPLEDLESTNVNLAHKFSELSKRLSDAQSSAVNTDRAATDRAAIRYRRLQEQWGAVVTEIRNLKGFSRFLLPPSYDDLQAAARHGPVIILIASQYSCNAIVVPTSGEPHHVQFPRITLAHLEKLKNDFAREIRHASFMRPKETRKELQVLLRTVWDEIMLPIVIVLQRDLRVTNGSRIWLCPTATFTSIPLHAAHPFRTKADGRRELCLEDVYICSYTPTLSALIRSRQMMKKRATPSFVAIGQSSPGAGQGEALSAVDSELELVRNLVPTTVNPTTLSGDNATQAGALDALQHNTWVHLACHGKQDREQPYNSRFAMGDKPLTLLDIMEKDIPHAEFAFLSACHTAVGDEKTPDEVIHLAAGLQFSGFKSVIGTLWVVDDAVAKHVVEAFYKNMVKDLKDGDVMDCTKAAWALNRATNAVKTKVPLEQRMVFIHIGV
ncbi:CHAT domain-containing protein [Suillus subalutaceus]|uniref:CHAT domain-containing protein n=1 Tax=Suillus subalutaceus TaxID=48586 RepID=UPI001B878BF2|nr:CHAT domain-containing protein [Suillus subalutaceus]KAG1850199.1 CHAT domain-containing protein [Suillus subalutaceus]